MKNRLLNLLPVLALLTGPAMAAAPRPNIILAMADDMGWDDPGYNSMVVTYADGTPHPSQGWINTPSNQLSVTYSDTTSPPAVSLSGPVLAEDDPYAVTITFSEAVTGLDASDFTVENGAASALSGSGANYTVTITPATSGDVSFTLPADSATNPGSGLGNTASNTLVTAFTLRGSGAGKTTETLVPAVSAAPGGDPGRTVDKLDNVPADGGNNVEKFTQGYDFQGAVNPFTTTLYTRSSSRHQLSREFRQRRRRDRVDSN